MRPLQGIRVLDLSSVIFGPLASQILADYGAEVIKIEPPEGDSTRQTGPFKEPGMSAIFLGANHSKQSVVLDLKQPAAQAALQALIAKADVLVQNFRPGTMRRLGLDAGKDVPLLCSLARQHFDVLGLVEVMDHDATGDVAALRACLTDCMQAAWQVSDAISGHYFSHTQNGDSVGA